MRKDPGKKSNFLSSRGWKDSKHSVRTVVENPSGEGPKFISHSLSGGENNQWFVRSNGNYKNLSALSGIDSSLDGRSFALLDYNRDGWMDVALVSCGAPRTQLFQNKLADLIKEPRKRFSIQLEGGNVEAKPSTQWSARDAYGAIIKIKTSLGTRMLSHQAGEGLSSQNTETLSIGLREGESVKLVTVYWPSGKVTQVIPQSNEVLLKEREP